MSQMTLFKPPDIFTERVKELKDNSELDREQAQLLLQVELGFALMECLGIDDEAVTAVWAILSGMPLRHPRLHNLDDIQRRAVANARQIIPFSARFAWLGALRFYIRNIPQNRRNYDFDIQDLDSQIIHAAKHLRDQVNQNLYESCLSADLEFRQRRVKPVKAGVAYQFQAKTEKETVTMQVQFTPEHLSTARQQPWFTTPRSREPFSLRIPDLESDAEFLNRREQLLARRYGWHESQKGHWVSRFRKINFHKIQADGTLSERNTQTLNLDGFVHIAGQVASGKSTLSTLLAVNSLRNHADRRITLVVSDVQSAIRLTNQINWWFCDDPENDEPVAVPLLGRSKRDAHLKSFYASKDFQEHWQRGQPHWGDRFLGTACALQGLLQASDIFDRLHGKPLKPGTEPCHSLKEAPKSESDRKKQNNNPGVPHLCPFFATCPSQQVYGDMPAARVWITTPGAMAMAGLPRHLELRPLKIGELVYLHSDIVVFDEVDTVIKWFDDVYAEEVLLTNGGVFDDIGVKTEDYMRFNRVTPALMQRWTGAERDVQKAVTATLTLLDKRSGHEFLNKWIERGYFTPNSLLYKFARRLAGLEELDSPDVTEQEIKANNRRVQQIMQYFDALLDDDPLQGQPRSNPKVNRLALLIQQINSIGESATDDSIYHACKAWIVDFFPKTEQRLARLRTEIEKRQNNSQQPVKKKRRNSSKKEEQTDPVDTIETLAYRLQFALTITLLDRHTRIIFYEWHHRPPTLDDEPPHRRMPTAMLNILPLPPTGRQFGTYYSRKDENHNQSENSSENALSLFAYTNIGRYYVLNFHRLLTDLDGQRGPNVLALSGTSYLRDSTQFHVGNPQGILMPEPSATEAIAQSRFRFLPQLNRKDEAIRISGTPERQKMGMFKEMAQALIGNNGSGHLGQELEELKRLGESAPDFWQDRERLLLLVNSYDQARWVADEIRQCWWGMREQVYHLQRDHTETLAEDDIDYQSRMEIGALNRADIETFSVTGGKILAAPISAMGRGFNILNANGKAAFGAVYFLTRPYPHPHDTQAIAQEINRRALDWIEDANFIAWEGDGILGRAEKVRQLAARYWRSVEHRSYYKTLRANEELRAFPRQDLAATTAGVIVQAVGRLLRGGVPFHAYFVDAAWGPNYAKEQQPDTPRTSLLAAIIDLLCDYVNEDVISQALYQSIADALVDIDGFNWEIDARDRERA
ncbi:MAG: hypothetical protein KME32_12075 [Mojavia pulchra JT2-VF2]|jgi:hypothetical protein|uniref:pPIWI-RE three-gene island domain-containing protein n=1 Tax=Mojavia pulchra JT2-VF2 TaxID=287848 RepID=A0A951PZM3_9NOST|nr:hypothetical protein [Mojavia pulchra JT2-VF2]